MLNPNVTLALLNMVTCLASSIQFSAHFVYTDGYLSGIMNKQYPIF